MFTYKNYQSKVFESIKDYFRFLNNHSKSDAFELLKKQNSLGSNKYVDLFDSCASICLRVPTGGGKTIMAAHAIKDVSDELNNSAPVVVWLVPSDTIRTQTLDALKKPGHPYRQAISDAYGDNFRICNLDELQTINPLDVNESCIIVLSTIQAFNVTDTAKRNVYSFNEELAPHFGNLTSAQIDGLEKVSDLDLESQPFLTQRDVGRVKYSIANWLWLNHPLVIVDEAHNNKTDRFFKTLSRINPSAVIEFTATPIDGNNVIHSVSAQELKAEQMIKLPIVLAEHTSGWEEALNDGILTRDRLEIISQRESDYIRPVALIQAQQKGEAATVEVVKKYLIEEQKIPEDQIAVATGDQKDLEGINLFDPQCLIRYVITVQALREGWDCSFAYVLISLQNVQSATSVEQLLGRVLRMPYAKERLNPELNKAYAHIVASSFSAAAATLKDRMVQNMGFERFEASSILIPKQSDIELEGGIASSKINECVIEVSEVPKTEFWPEEIKTLVTFKETSQGISIVLDKQVSHEQLNQIQGYVENSVPKKDVEKVKNQFEDHRASLREACSPAELGQNFGQIPQLCLRLDDGLELVDGQMLSFVADFDLLGEKIGLPGFDINNESKIFEIDINKEKVTFRFDKSKQLDIDGVESHLTESDLVRWLDREVRHINLGVTQLALQSYLLKLVRHLTIERGFPLRLLINGKIPLSKAISAEIHRLKQLAIKKGFQQNLPGMLIADDDQLKFYSFSYRPGIYPLNVARAYKGSFEFKKHFYGQIHDLREKTGAGATSEEFSCAVALDSNPDVKYWVRNIEREPKHSFWLPTATDNFYPDFVAELKDGRIMAVEYKGEVYATNDDSLEKKSIGQQWERASRGKCLFLFATKDDVGRDVSRQITDKIKQK
jgi:type III restriction enzyme